MPFPNEHAARLRDPKECDPDTFRRTAGGTLFGKIEVPKTIGIIWAKLKTANGDKDNPIAQALRFPVKDWTAAEARKWLKDKGVKIMSFEPASGNSEQGEAPASACVFECQAESVRFGEGAPDNGFVIVAYDGSVVNHPYWGNLAIDLEGLKFAAKRLPVLDSHWTSARMGFTTHNVKDADGVRFEGKFVTNDMAKQMRQDMLDGFPMQASLNVPPSKVEQVMGGASTEVNGRTLKGPGAVFREATVKEVSMCVFGALKNTSTTAFADAKENGTIQFDIVGKDTTMAEKKEVPLTLDQFRAQNPDGIVQLESAAHAEGVKSEQSRFAALRQACGEDTALLAVAFAEGWSTEKVHAERSAKLAAENADLRARLAAQAPPASPIDKATAEFKAQPAPTPAPPAFDESTATEDQLHQRFEAVPDLRTQFRDVDEYVACVKAERSGRVKVLKGR